MHLESRTAGKHRHHYLAHSWRTGGKVRKLRIYLGADLSKKELEAKKREAEPTLRRRIEARLEISDPFQTVLSPAEMQEVRAIEAEIEPKVFHLSEDDWRKFTEAFAYDTNAIEGSTVDEGEVKGILERDKWPEKPKAEISETYGVAKAVAHMRKTREHVSLGLMLDFHRLVFGNSKPFAGRLRPRGVEVVITDGRGGIAHRGAPSTHVKPLLKELVAWYGKNRAKYPPLVLAAVVHNQFENIHPFQDGNGRVGRLLLNNVLIKHGLPPLNIEFTNRREYYAALQAYEKEHSLRPTLELFLEEYRALKRSLGK